ncbi:MAG: NAD(P)-dependent oxidoreductase [Chloroflexi bacterium]|nr:NAD(P)-dependent oxidoreductase [Chloroflexota bacterium]
MTRRVLITGAGGFVCRQITAVLLSHDYAVIANDRAFDDDLKRAWSAQWGGQLTLIEADVMQLPDLRVDAVVHGAAVTASPEERGQSPEANFQANLDPLLRMFRWANANCTGRAIFISSDAIFERSDPGLIYETDPVVSLGLYGIAKQMTESLVRTLQFLYGREMCTIRLGNIYGPLERARPTRPRVSMVGQMIHEALTTQQITVNVRAPARDWTFAADVGRAVRRLIEAPTLNHALYQVASEQVLTPMQIAETIQARLPAVQIRTVEAPVDVPRRGHMSHTRLHGELGFDEWTPFAVGIQQIIAQQAEILS